MCLYLNITALMHHVTERKTAKDLHTRIHKYRMCIENLFIFNYSIVRYFPIRVLGNISVSDTYRCIGYGYSRGGEVSVIHSLVEIILAASVCLFSKSILTGCQALDILIVSWHIEPVNTYVIFFVY